MACSLDHVILPILAQGAHGSQRREAVRVRSMSPARKLRRVSAVRTAHQDLEIWKSDLATEFRVAGAVHAFYHRRRFLTGLVWDMLAAAALLGDREEPRSVLMLGLAGGTSLRTLRHLLPSCRFTAIDIDGEIVRLARRHMALDDTGAEVVIGDAYAWLQKNRRTFDVVIDDIYLAGRTDVFRPQAIDRRLLENLRRCVAPGGVLAVNLVTGPGHRAAQSATRRILRDAFAEVRAVTSPEAMNEVLVAGQFVGTMRRLRHCTSSFQEASDRAFWRKISVRQIT
ncbi:MAG: spermidine synthase [Chthoniobacterales bacterium]